MSLGKIMVISGAVSFLLGLIRWMVILIKGPKEKRRMEMRMREKY